MKHYLHRQPDWPDTWSCNEINNQKIIRLLKRPLNLQNRFPERTQKTKHPGLKVQRQNHTRDNSIWKFYLRITRRILVQKYLNAVTYMEVSMHPDNSYKDERRDYYLPSLHPAQLTSILLYLLFSILLCHIPLFRYFATLLCHSHPLCRGMSIRIKSFSGSGQCPSPTRRLS